MIGQEAQLTIDSSIGLNDGGRIPLLGFGVFQAKDGEECQQAVRVAIAAGYRHIDTAAAYGNEASVGRALAEAGVPRGDLFLTTKTPWDQSPDGLRVGLDASLKALQTDYVDLYLIHWPLADASLPAAWATLQQFKAAGRCRSIGVSNFTIERFEKAFLPHAGTMPAVNQVELHVFNQRDELVDYCRAKGMQIEAYSVLTRNKRLAGPHPVLAEVAAEHGKTVPQVMIRYVLQKGIVALVKSVTPARIRENAAVFDFELTPEEMRRLDGLNEDLVVQDWFPKGYY